MEHHGEAASFAQLRVDEYASLHALHNGLADGEAQTSALLKLIYLVEAVEHLLAVFFRKSHTSVLHIHQHLVLILVKVPTQSDGTLTGELGGIGKEVG